MSTIQSLKNFIRHGKQARLVTPHAEPTTNISAVHAEQQRQPQGTFSPAAGNLDAIDSKMGSGQPQQSQQSSPDAPAAKRAREAELEQIIAEEKSSRSKMPKYPGLERWILVEKMGDGAFSNVYRAKDTTGEFDQVAIKVVRKFEMNSTQVGYSSSIVSHALLLSIASVLFFVCCGSYHGPSSLRTFSPIFCLI
jgi:hypothetical protein